MCVCVFMCVREGEEGGGEQRERERDKESKHTRCVMIDGDLSYQFLVLKTFRKSERVRKV